MCKYCDNIHGLIDEYESKGGDVWQDKLREIALFEYDPTGEGNADVLLFANGVQYDVLSPGFEECLSFRYCPMCGKPFAPNAGEDIYAVTENVGLPVDRVDDFYDLERDARDYAETLAEDNGQGCVITYRPIRKQLVFPPSDFVWEDVDE